MKTASLVLLLLLPLLAWRAHAAVFEWIDDAGVVHFTDDSKNIPAKYRKKTRVLELPEAAPAGSGGQPQRAEPQRSPSRAAFPGGHSEEWWRQRFAALRGEVKTLQDGLQTKQAKLVELRRTRTIYQRGRDREAINALEAEMAADEKRIADLLKQLDAVDQEATRQAVPGEWRR